MIPGDKLKIATPSDNELVLTWVFDAPRPRVFDAMTRPERIREWMLGPPGWTMPVCEVDLRAGGKFRFEWEGPGGFKMGMGGEHREVVVPERIVRTEKFDQDWTGGETLGRADYAEKDGRTTVTITVRYPSRAARDGALGSGMTQGIAMNFDRLAGLLAAS